MTSSFLRLEAFLSYVIMQGICNKLIEMKISVGCIILLWFRLWQDWTFVIYWWEYARYLKHFSCCASKEKYIDEISIKLIFSNMVKCTNVTKWNYKGKERYAMGWNYFWKSILISIPSGPWRYILKNYYCD